jgi:hypothetical protein
MVRERGFSLCFCDFFSWKVALGFFAATGLSSQR